MNSDTTENVEAPKVALKRKRAYHCWKCGSKEHWSGNCPDKEKIEGWPHIPEEKKTQKKKRVFHCWKCGSKEHWSGDCPDKENIEGWPHRPEGTV